ncbi:TonB family protein [Pantoea rwandensis]|uniref:Protein TonB n=1 Tax=Pantoea rwandensis TaxID=1076550 RepID=A0A1X1CNZ4_9GAMM|nr:TonB family protein [Pantoea rwandensis]ORM66135.1 energy transducer TonB [Pantoea rwandensis]
MRKLLFLTLILFSAISSAANIIHYPERAEKLRIDGEVNVLYDVNERGTPENIRVLTASPKYVFDRDVQKQIATWRYPSGNPERDIPLRVIFKAN